MSNIINLNKARKAKDRRASRKQAAENRVQFGRSKAEKDRTKKLIEREQASLDGKKSGPTPANTRQNDDD